MRWSQFFLFTLREVPTEAQILSHRYMLRAGMVRQTSAGIYAWLPLGFRVLKKIEQIIRSEQDRAGSQEILMPTLQSADLWKKSGRYDDYGQEMLRLVDRHGREMVYGPTNEEMITDIFTDFVQSYRDLPLNLYHIQWKFRDEIRPRYGVMRGREFLMKDGYSFDYSVEGARCAYQRMFLAYLRTFARLDLQSIPMRAESGAIGGDLSHEFVILSSTGESEVFCHRDWLSFDPLVNAPGYGEDLEAFFQQYTHIYAATQDKHVPHQSPVAEEDLIQTRGIEVGHIFSFGTKYSQPLGAMVTLESGESVPVHMGSYGIGVSRMVGALIEANHDDLGIMWPECVAPFQVGLINLNQRSFETERSCEEVYRTLLSSGVEVLYDDREETAGVKFTDMDLIGLPWQIIVGPRGVQAGTMELKNRRTGERYERSQESIVSMLLQTLSKT